MCDNIIYNCNAIHAKDWSICYIFTESTHTVDGSPLWRLTLDEDLFCTLRLRFPSWFDSNNSAISKNSDKNIVHTVAEKLVDVTNEMAEGMLCACMRKCKYNYTCIWFLFFIIVQIDTNELCIIIFFFVSFHFCQYFECAYAFV